MSYQQDPSIKPVVTCDCQLSQVLSDQLSLDIQEDLELSCPYDSRSLPEYQSFPVPETVNRRTKLAGFEANRFGSIGFKY